MKTRRLQDGREVAVHDNPGGLRKVCGCPRREWPKCRDPWHFSFKWAGVAYRFSLDRQLGRRVRTKAEARIEADRLRLAIREGSFIARGSAAPAADSPPDSVTFEELGGVFVRLDPIRAGKRKGQPRGQDDRSRLAALAVVPGADDRPLGPRPVGSLVVADLEAGMRALRARKLAGATLNKYRQTILQLQAFGKRKGYLRRLWVEDLTDAVDLHRARGAERHRRLEPGEEEAILRVADPRLGALFVAAIETGLRLGELLALRWRDVGSRLLHVRDSKTGAGRHVPISARARAVLDMRATSPTGGVWPADVYVFGNGIGQKVGAPDRAWESAVLRAHGIVPHRTATKALTAESRASYQQVDLTFHDLRHECGSRLLEAGMPLHEVSRLLGHANIATTSRYLNATAHGLLATMERIDAARAAALRFVASEADGEQRPLRNDVERSSVQVTVN